MTSESGPRPIRVCLDARLVSGDRGGVEQVVIGLADELSRLTDAPDEYPFLVDRDHEDWLRPYAYRRLTNRGLTDEDLEILRTEALV